VNRGDRLSPDQISQAAHWMARLWSDNATAQDHAACAHWRQADPAHEHAWQQLQQLQLRFDAVPTDGASRILGRRNEVSRRRMLAIAGLLCSGAGLAAMGSRQQWQPLTADQRTGTGERRELQLADGTRLLLNTATSLNLKSSAGGHQLQLLQGELLVTSNTNALPLQLHCRDGLITPQSSRFCLRQYAHDSQLSVFSGNVQISLAATGSSAVLAAGEATRFSRSLIATPQMVDPTALAWTEGKLVAERLPLTHFIAELGRYRPGVLRIDPSLAVLQITGVFSLHDTDATLARLPKVLPVRVRYFSRYWVSIDTV